MLIMTLIIKLTKQEDIESSQPCQKTNCGSSFVNVPDDVFFKICSYLRLQEIWTLGSVCAKWHHLTRSEAIWSRTDTLSLRLSPEQSQKLLKSLPPCVKELKIGGHSDREKQTLAVPALFHILLKRFPQLDTLIIENAVLAKPCETFNFMDGFMLNCTVPWKQQTRRHYSVIKYSSREMEADVNTLVCLLKNLTVLSFRNTVLAIEDIFPVGNIQITSPRIRILDLTRSPCANDQTIESFSRLPFLEELYLSGTAVTVNGVCTVLNEVHKLKVLDLDDTVVGGETFAILRKHGKSFVEICLGGTAVTDSDIVDVAEGNFPALKKLCLVRTDVSEIGVKKLLLTVPSLECVVITKDEVEINCVLDKLGSVKEKLYNDCNENEACNHFLRNNFNGAF